jgi:hypothetical protein
MCTTKMIKIIERSMITIGNNMSKKCYVCTLEKRPPKFGGICFFLKKSPTVVSKLEIYLRYHEKVFQPLRPIAKGRL